LSILLRRRPIPDGCFVSTYTDVTEQVEARQEAEQTLQLLDTVIDAVPAILHVKDRDLRYRFVNRYFLEMFDLQREDVLGRKRSEVLRPEWLPDGEERARQVFESGKVLPFYEMPLQRPNGEDMEVLGTKAPLLDSDGQVSQVVTVEVDITERKRIQRELAESEELHRLLVDLSPYGILLYDENGINFLNPGGRRILGLSDTDDVVGRSYLDFVADTDHTTARDRLAMTLRGESIGQTERRMVTYDSREIVAASSGVPVIRQGKPMGLIIFADITEVKNAEKEIARQQEALHQADKISALGSLLAGVAHELNNPLSIVVGRSAMLENAELEPRVAASVASIRNAAERCAKIVKTFLAMARKQAPTRLPVRVDLLVRSSLDLLSYGLSSAGIKVTTDLPEDLPQTMADPDQLGQVFSNLITNAQQALLGWGGPRKLSISAQHDRANNQLHIIVDDSGPGIADELRTRIFDPFFTTKPAGGGTGIGLAVCRGIVEAHDGAINLDVAPEGGARFEVVLPIVGTLGATQEEPPAVPEAAPHRILIVDDEAEIRAMLAEILAAEGHEVLQAGNGREALARIRENDVDLVISDLIMPELDGPGLYDVLCRRDPKLSRHLLFITGDTLSGSARSFLERVDRPAIEKPFVPSEVLRAVSEELERID
ncbi:MAG: PAS domain S-box protein, partial [Pseudomonadota bacterium]